MRKFIKNNYRTILFILIIGLIIGGIFLYREIRNNSGEYTPNDGPVEYEIKKYEENQYEVAYIDAVDVYRAYYKEYLRLLITNPQEAFNKLSPECKEYIFENDYNKFYEYTKKIDKSMLAKGNIVRYNVTNNAITVIDNTDSSYVFNENGVWNYTVYLNGRMN